MMQLVLLNNENEIDIIVIVVAICLHNVLINFCSNHFSYKKMYVIRVNAVAYQIVLC